MKIGIVGCGNISDVYFQAGGRFDALEIISCADLDIERATAKAEQYGCRACSVDELIADSEIEMVINLTVPKAHAQISIAALEAGKHVYGEKPLAVSREDGKKIIDTAKARGLRVGCAPDTFLGGGLQTCSKLIEDGWIGKPIGATGFMMCHGPESWHPDPAFFYQVGGGPMFDMGPYYITAMIALLGPVKAVTGIAKVSLPERVITSQPKYGQKVQVEVPTHIAGLLDFECGAVATLVTSFDVWAANLPNLEIYGTEGTLSVPDPNTFGGPIKVKRWDSPEWMEMPLSHGYADQSRGVGAADMATAIKSGRAHRANGDQAFHVLDIMHAFHDASNQSRHIKLESTCAKPALLPMGLLSGILDD